MTRRRGKASSTLTPPFHGPPAERHVLIRAALIQCTRSQTSAIVSVASGVKGASFSCLQLSPRVMAVFVRALAASDLPRATPATTPLRVFGSSPLQELHLVQESLAVVPAPPSLPNNPALTDMPGLAADVGLALQHWRPVPPATEGTLTRLPLEQPKFLVMRDYGGYCKWPYCLLCSAWADTQHLLSRRHTQRMQWPEYYLESTETESTRTPFDADDEEDNPPVAVIVHHGTPGQPMPTETDGGEHLLGNVDNLNTRPSVAVPLSRLAAAVTGQAAAAPPPPPPPPPLPSPSPPRCPSSQQIPPPPSDPPSPRSPTASGPEDMEAAVVGGVAHAAGPQLSREVEVEEAVVVASDSDCFTTEELGILDDLKHFLEGWQKSNGGAACGAKRCSESVDEMLKDSVADGTSCYPKTNEQDPWAAVGGNDPWAAAAQSQAHARTSASVTWAVPSQG